MGRCGPAPQPTVLKINHGNPGKRPLNDREPKPPRRRPRRPQWLQGEGRKVWEELVPLLDGMGVLTVVDRLSLARYCKLTADWVKLSKVIDEHGDVYPVRDKQDKTVGFRMLPQVKVRESLSAELRQLDREFGLTPSARSRLIVEAEPTQEPDLLEQLIAGGRERRLRNGG